MLTNEFDRKEKEIFTSKDYMSPLKDCPKTAVSFFSTVIEEQFIKLFNPTKEENLLMLIVDMGKEIYD